MKAFTVMGRTLKAIYEELFLCVFLSLVWWAGTILIIPAGPVAIGLHRVANRVANYRRADSSFFWEAAREEIGRSWLLYIIRLLMPVAIFVNIFFYLNGEVTWMRIIGIAWAWIMLLVLMISQYIFPLFWQQEEYSLKMILRNAFILALRYPLYTILMLLFQLVLFLLCVVLTIPVFLLMPAVLAFAANFGLVGVLQELNLAPEPPQVGE